MIVAFGNPYVASLAARLPAVMLTYDFGDAPEAAAVRALCGEAPIGGRLPISIPGLYPAGHGLVRAAVPPACRPDDAAVAGRVGERTPLAERRVFRDAFARYVRPRPDPVVARGAPGPAGSGSVERPTLCSVGPARRERDRYPEPAPLSGRATQKP